MKRVILTGYLLLSLSLGASAADLKSEVVATGLNNPVGVAVQPETGTLFVSDSGAGRIVTVANGGLAPVISGFPRDVYGKGPMFDIGPLGLAFVNKNLLAIGDGGSLDGEEYLRVFELATDDKGALKPITVYDSKYKLGPIPAGKETGRGEGNFYGVAAGTNGIYITANGDDTKGWVLKAALKDGVPGAFKPFIATKEKVAVDAPVAITIGPKGQIVVGQMGEVVGEPDSLVCFYNAKGDLESKAELEDVFDVVGLAYSKSGKLYGLDFRWPGKEKGSLFSIEVTADGASVKKLMDLDKPTGMAFGADGALYITTIGTPAAGDSAPAGKLLKVTGDF